MTGTKSERERANSMQTQAEQFFSPGIHITATPGTAWALVTERSTYAMGVSPEGYIVNLHWGARLATFSDLPEALLAPEHASQNTALSAAREEYPGYGGLRYGEVAARVAFADGVRDLDLRYERYELDVAAPPDGLPLLKVYLHDTVYPLQVILRYQVDAANDLIIRSTDFINQGSDPIRLERIFSAAWHLPLVYQPRMLTTLAGQWAGEGQIQRRPLTAGTMLLESRAGITGLNASPWFALEAGYDGCSPAAETYFGTLAWSGNWMIRLSADTNGRTTLTGGISEHDFAWTLAGGETFATPAFLAGFAEDGLNGVRRRLHRYTRTIVLPQAQARVPRPVLYNSWEATFFDVQEGSQMQLAERAATLGVELFIVDDGWFRGRSSDRAGLGDWSADPQKFPEGLGPLVEHVNALGMNFGLWVEPEMVNPDSDLYRKHPDWVYAFPTRARSEARNQLVLNLGRADVQAYLLEVLNGLATRHPIAHLKWDMNRPISEPGWTDYLATGGEAREIWVRHTLGVYAVIDELRTRHPQLTIESCASGGGRVDYGILRRTDQVWSSDNTHAEARLLIQEGLSLLIPARTMGAWVTDAGRGQVPLAYRFHVAMLGALGIGGNLLRWSTEEMDEAANWIAIYKVIRPLIQDGDQIWLLTPFAQQGSLAAVQYISADQAEGVVFAFRRSPAFGSAMVSLRLQGLDEFAFYEVEHLHVSSEQAMSATVYSGKTLMARGLELRLPGQIFASCLASIRRIPSTSATGIP